MTGWLSGWNLIRYKWFLEAICIYRIKRISTNCICCIRRIRWSYETQDLYLHVRSKCIFSLVGLRHAMIFWRLWWYLCEWPQRLSSDFLGMEKCTAVVLTSDDESNDYEERMMIMIIQNRIEDDVNTLMLPPCYYLYIWYVIRSCVLKTQLRITSEHL